MQRVSGVVRGVLDSIAYGQIEVKSYSRLTVLRVLI